MIQLTNDMNIESIKNAFNKIYPGLRLAFYEYGHMANEGSAAGTELVNSLTLSEVGFQASPVVINTDAEQSVADFEKQFEALKFHVQVFRKSNQLWLQTTRTDDWTLFEQNRKGLNSSKAFE